MKLKLKGDRWDVEPIMRLAGTPEVWLGEWGTIGILGSEGAMQISAEGNPSWVYCPSPMFP